MASPDLSRRPNRRRSNEAAVERVQAEVARKELRQLNIEIPVELHRALRIRALEVDMSLRELCIEVLEAYLAK